MGAVTSYCSIFTIFVDIVTICILVILFIVTISSSLCADWLSVESANQHFSPSTSLNLPFTAICQPHQLLILINITGQQNQRMSNNKSCCCTTRWSLYCYLDICDSWSRHWKHQNDAVVLNVLCLRKGYFEKYSDRLSFYNAAKNWDQLIQFTLLLTGCCILDWEAARCQSISYIGLSTISNHLLYLTTMGTNTVLYLFWYISWVYFAHRCGAVSQYPLFLIMQCFKDARFSNSYWCIILVCPENLRIQLL